MSHTCLLIHIVFATHKRTPALHYQSRKELYAYISGIIKNVNSKLIAIGGVADHIHIFVDIRPSVAVSDLVKKLKQSAGNWLKNNPNFPCFDGWQEGYFAGSVGPDGKQRCINYINNQMEHHHGKSFEAEMEWLNLKYEIEEYIKNKVIPSE